MVIREVRVAMEGPMEETMVREVPEAVEEGFATWERSSTVLPNCCIQGADSLSSPGERSHPLPGRALESNR